MTKKGKMRVSKTKRNNQTTNKMKKQGKLRLQRHRNKMQRQNVPPQAPDIEYSDSESESGDEWADMLDEEEQQYIVKQIAKNPNLLSSKIDEEEKSNNSQPKKRKRTRDKVKVQPQSVDETANISGGDSDVEEKYEKERSEQPAKKLRPLLPIKTKEGVVERSEECNETESEDEQPSPKISKIEPSQSSSDESEDEDSGVDSGSNEADEEVIGAVQLLAARRDTLQKEKLRIGALCSSLLESPEKKLKNFFPILYLMEEHLKDGTANLLSVRKLASLSAQEVFKDILPDYQIRHQDYSNVKLKKDTLSLYKYEKELLEFYKRYLQRLEKATSVLRLKRGDHRKIDKSQTSLAVISVRCLCELLSNKPQSNYSTNIAQCLVPLLGCRNEDVRNMVSAACAQVFREDRKGDISLSIVRLINQLVKRRAETLPPSALDCLLSLRIKDIELDHQDEIKHKKKQEEKHKKRIVNLSKKEKKRQKNLKEVERELLETEAQENDLARRKQMTEVTKTVFHIYFRILKTNPRSKLLSAVLKGLAKFTHTINLEFYSELVSILSRLIKDEVVDERSKLECVHTALAILASVGDAVNVDPGRFHDYLYQNMMTVHVVRDESLHRSVLAALSLVLTRVRRVSSRVLAAVIVRAAVLAGHVSGHAALGDLGAVRGLLQSSKPLESLLDTTEQSGAGLFDPYLPSAEHCNALAARLYVLPTLARHYHPAVRDAVKDIWKDTASGGGTILGRLTPLQLFDQYDGSKMCFKPAIPPPKSNIQRSKMTPTHHWTQTTLRDECLHAEDNIDMNVEFSELLPKEKIALKRRMSVKM